MDDRVIENSLDFILRAARDFEDPDLSADQQLKYSTIHLYEGIELALKARLLREHWTLVLTKPEKCNKEKFEAGDFQSVTFESACDRIANLCGAPLPKMAIVAFDALRKLRNKYVHFVCPETKDVVLSCQVVAWRELLDLFDARHFGPLHEQAARLLIESRDLMNQAESYLRERLKPTMAALPAGTDLTDCQCLRPYLAIFVNERANCLFCGYSPPYLADFAQQLYGGPTAFCQGCGHRDVGPASQPGSDVLRTRLPPPASAESRVLLCYSCFTPSWSDLVRKCDTCGVGYVDLPWHERNRTSCSRCILNRQTSDD